MDDNPSQKRILAGVEALQNDQTRRNIEDEDLSKSVFTLREQHAIKELVHEALVEFFKTYGLAGKSFIVGAAIIIGSLTVILGGAKVILGWIGFSYMSRG